MSYTSGVTYIPSANLRVAGTYTAELNLSYGDELLLFLNITEISGSPTLDITLQVADPNGVWYDHTIFSQKTNIAKDSKSISIFGDRTRIVAVVGGSSTPRVTFSVTGVVKTR